MGDGRGFHTWRFEGEVNLESMVEPNKVRQSHRYKVDVRLPDGEWAESFVHEAIPRNGRGRIYSPWDHPRSNTLDPFTLGPFKMGPSVDDGITTGVEVESSGKALVTMAWTQFEYQRDVEVKISRGTWTRGTWTIDRATPDLAANVVIRPTTQPYEIKDAEDGGIIVLVPRDDHGRRFSVEFHDDSLEYRTNGQDYVSSGGQVVGVEPRHALLVFASPCLPAWAQPLPGPWTLHTMRPGPIRPATDLGSSGVADLKGLRLLLLAPLLLDW
ncbi:unnamed protein product [Prorocentrum cordatum]|uniref:Glycoside hydrolase family 49 N-terminal domain-containing protein n=1 Tax=Prorocentrum cordatum TaxID=2364126 RepID=A0ABN9R9V5_9DINO|nr:unnamed protein product [Polarella glacialis]